MILHTTPHSLLSGDVAIATNPAFSPWKKKDFHGQEKQLKDSIIRMDLEFSKLNIEKALAGVDCIMQKRMAGQDEYFLQYKRIYDHVTLPLDPSVKQLDCIFSFQEHSYGNFVVIRNNFIKTNTAINADGLQSQQWLRFGYNFYSRRTGDFIRSYESFAGELEKLPLKERYEILEKAFQADEPKWAAPAGSFKKLAALFSAN